MRLVSSSGIITYLSKPTYETDGIDVVTIPIDTSEGIYTLEIQTDASSGRLNREPLAVKIKTELTNGKCLF
jgi:DNA repair ATPase RecN